nr:MAG TPA: hypothetical protein [Caudoviricetes sp.]
MTIPPKFVIVAGYFLSACHNTTVRVFYFGAIPGTVHSQ